MSFLTFRVIFAAAFLSLALGPFCYWLSCRLHLVDVPGSKPHKLHPNAVPLAGGIVIFTTVILASIAGEVLHLPSVWPILAPAGIIFAFGLLDDAKGLSVLWKLSGQILATLLLVQLGTQVLLFQSAGLNILVTFLWIIGVTNAYNFVDSMDGLATGLAGLAAAFFMLVTFDSGQIELSLFSAVVLGACVGSYFYNSAPARFFLGDSGSQFLGFGLAALAIAYTPDGFLRSQSWFIPILLVGVPIFDTALVVVSRLRRKHPIYLGNLDHTYHRLVAMGIASNRAIVTMHMAALLLGFLAFIALPLPPIQGNLIFFFCLFAGIGLIIYLDRKKWWP
jgi:UDP-GlcNAc:undecaprenyl-phosphate/decaprenyl-phosphate GlcNAc-1-phosphate transferase